MNNAEFNCLSSESVCRVFTIARDKEEEFINSYEQKRIKMEKEIKKLKVTDENSIFKRRAFIVTDSSVAKISGELAYSKKELLYKLCILKIKQGQVNESIIFNKMTLNKKYPRNEEVEIMLKVSNKELKIKVDISELETYKDVLLRIVDEINEVNLGIVAEYIEQKTKNNSICAFIKLQGEEGSQGKFEVKVCTNGILNNLFSLSPIKIAQDTEYELCGKRHITTKANVNMNKYVQITLLKVGTTYLSNDIVTKLTLIDLEKAINMYNDMLDFLTLYTNFKVVAREQKRFASMYTDIEFRLASIGIEVAKSGKLMYDSKKLKKVITEKCEEVKYLIGRDGGLADRILYIFKTSSISRERIVKTEATKNKVQHYYTHMKNNVAIDTPMFLIEENNLKSE